MTQKKKFFIILITGIVLIVFFFLITGGISKFTGHAITENDQNKIDMLAQCLTSNQIKMYGTEWCPHCKDQKELFGSSFKYVDYIDCDKQRETCLIAGIQGYPTWIINNQKYPGTQSLEKLKQLSNC